MLVFKEEVRTLTEKRKTAGLRGESNFYLIKQVVWLRLKICCTALKPTLKTSGPDDCPNSVVHYL